MGWMDAWDVIDRFHPLRGREGVVTFLCLVGWLHHRRGGGRVAILVFIVEGSS